MNQLLGHVVGVNGSQMTARLEPAGADEDAYRIGATVKVWAAGSEVVGTVAAVGLEPGPPPHEVLVVDLIGELARAAGGPPRFVRGVSRFPASGAPLVAATEADMAAIYAPPLRAPLRIGALHQDAGRPACLLMDELLSKHFAVLGATGSGKSCAVTLLLSAMLAEHPNAHVVLLDPHNEYSAAFGNLAEVINVDNLQLPLWLLDFEEAVGLLVRGGTAREQQAQAIILKDAIIRARRCSAEGGQAAGAITVDTPAPYLTADLLRFISEAMGKLDKPDTSVPYLRLKTRIESLRDDRRFGFMLSERLVAIDTLPQFIARILRLPPDGRPLTIIDLSGLPSEIADVVVSLACRVIFDFVLWSEVGRVPPILVVCEEAHRYVPADERLGFAAAARAITRLAKEGRKYGISLGLVSQRPAELSPTALSQCGTILALRMDEEVDQRFVAARLPEVAHGMLSALPTLPVREAIASGEGVPLPIRLRFDELPPRRRPRSEGAVFSKAWRADAGRTVTGDRETVESGIRRWRLQTRSPPTA